MSDESVSPIDEQASAYLDDMLDAEARARVEDSPDVMVQVDSFRRLRAALADAPVPDAARLEQAIVAALASAEAAPAAAAFAATAPPAPNVTSIDRHRRWSRMLTAAAAVVLVGVAGVAASKLATTSSDEDSSSVVAPAADDAGSKSAPPEGDAGMETAGGGAATDNSVTSGGSETTADATETTADGSGITALNTGASPVPEYDEPAELQAIEEPATPVVLNIAFDCPLAETQEIVAEITWKGTPAVVVRDTVSGVISALDQQCAELASVQP